MKKLLAVLLCSTMVIGMLTACGSSSSEPAAEPAAEEEAAPAEEAEAEAEAEPAAEPADGEVYVMKVGHDHTTTSPFHICMQEFETNLEEASGGRIDVEIYPGQQLGSAREMIEMTQMGTLEATLLPTAKFGGFDQRLNLADMPFLASSEEDFLELMNGEIGQEAMDSLPEIGIKGLAYFGEGYKYITNNVKPITKPDDLKGLKIRTMEAPIIMAMFEAWGANPVPIDFSEVYNSLQQGVVDGEENPLLSIHDMKFYEVQKYMTIDTHAYLSYFFSVSNSWFESLPADLQDCVVEQVEVAKNRCRELMEEYNAGYLKTIEESGTEVYTLSEEETAAFKEAVQPVYEEFRDTIGGDLLDRAVAKAEELAADN